MSLTMWFLIIYIAGTLSLMQDEEDKKK